MSRAKLGTGRALSKPITWLLRDEFSDVRAAGAVNGTMPTPGPGGARVVTDTTSALSIASGNAVISSASTNWGDPGTVWGIPVPRLPGLLTLFSISSSGGVGPRCGFGTSATASDNTKWDCVVGLNSNTDIRATIQGIDVSLATISSGAVQRYAIDLRSAGAFVFLYISGSWLLSYIFASPSTSTIYPIFAGRNSTSNNDYQRLCQSNWLPSLLVSDGFGSSFGTTDGLGHAEGVSGGIGSGGGNVAWTQQVGTWTVSSGKAAAATLSGGIAVATVPTPTADVFAKVKVTRSAGAGGMVLRWTDANNHLYTEHDGTNAYLKQVLAGSTTTLITAAATYSAGAELVPDLNGTAGRLYWNNALVGSTSSISSSLTSTLHGLRSTDTGGIQLDDFVAYAKGTGGEYNVLNRYVNL